MTDNLRDLIADALEVEGAPGSKDEIWADVIIDLLIDMAGKGELLKSIDGMHR